jgi:hypothetical protein
MFFPQWSTCLDVPPLVLETSSLCRSYVFDVSPPLCSIRTILWIGAVRRKDAACTPSGILSRCSRWDDLGRTPYHPALGMGEL